MSTASGVIVSDVEFASKEDQSGSWIGSTGESIYEFKFIVKGSYAATGNVDELRLRLEKSKILLEMKRQSCVILTDLRTTMERNMVALRRERRELMRMAAAAYRKRLRNRRH